MLRDPAQQRTPSLLDGVYFHDRLVAAYETVPGQATGRPAAPDEPVDLYLTGTLWEGRRSAFTDDMGRRITEVDYGATFRFTSDRSELGAVGEQTCGDLRALAVTDELATASRCTASFPGAFEPWRVEVADRTRAGRWISTAGLADFDRSQYVVDGGVLMNKPIRPALEAVYRQSADTQVRRVMTYVVPDPGEPSSPAGPTAGAHGSDGGGHDSNGVDGPGSAAAPGAGEVLMGVMTRLRSTGSVSAELSEIEQRNDSSRERRRTRDRLAQALTEAGGERRGPDGSPSPDDLPSASFPAYLEVRVSRAADEVSGLLLSGPGAADHRWSRRELAAMLREIGYSADGLPFVPTGDLAGALSAPAAAWRWGQSAVSELGDTAVDLLRRALWLAPLSDPTTRLALATCRRRLHTTLAGIRSDSVALADTWRQAGAQLPPRGDRPAVAPSEWAALRAALVTACTGWEHGDLAPHRSALRGQALAVAATLADVRDELVTVSRQESVPVDPAAVDLRRLRTLVELLLPDGDPELVLRRMLRLEVVQSAFAGSADEVEQVVELVQISSPDSQLLTGVQEHHFGAFYRRSWRANDWMRGRLDGSEQLVDTLLQPVRLQQLGLTAETALRKIHDLAVGPPGALEAAHLQQQWQLHLDGVRDELAYLDGAAPVPRALPCCSARVVERLHLQVLAQEVGAIADAVEREPEPLPDSAAWAARVRAAQAAQATGRLAPEVLLRLADGAQVVARQRIRQEVRQGTDTFARTATKGFAALAATLGTLDRPKPVGIVMRAFRGYALLVWALVGFASSGSNLGSNAVVLAGGLGAGLLAVALVVPGMPLGVPLLGALLLLAAGSVAALRHPDRRARGIGLRLAVAAAVVLAVVIGIVVVSLVGDSAAQARSTLWSALAKVAIAVAVVGLGWFIAAGATGRSAQPPLPPTSGAGDAARRQRPPRP